MARTAAGSRSRMDGYELRDHLSQHRLRPIGGYFENFYSSVSRISEEIYLQQAVYFLLYLLIVIPYTAQPVPVVSTIRNIRLSPY